MTLRGCQSWSVLVCLACVPVWLSVAQELNTNEQSWLPDPAASNSTRNGNSSNSNAGNTAASWLSGLAGPTALISSPSEGAVLTITGDQPVYFDGSASHAQLGSRLIGYDWEIIGTLQVSGRPYETAFVGPAHDLVLPAGAYSVTLTVAAAPEQGAGAMAAGSDYIAAFTVVNATAEAEEAAADDAARLAAVKAAEQRAAAARAAAAAATAAAAAAAAAAADAGAAPSTPPALALMETAMLGSAAPSAAGSTTFLPPEAAQFAWAFEPVVREVDAMYGEGSVWQQQLKAMAAEEAAKAQVLAELAASLAPKAVLQQQQPQSPTLQPSTPAPTPLEVPPITVIPPSGIVGDAGEARGVRGKARPV